MTAGEIRRATIAHLGPRHIDAVAWATVAAVTIGTNLIDFATVPDAGTRPGAAFAAAALVRVVLVLWIGYALLRQVAQVYRPFAVTGAAWRFALLFLALLVAYGVVSGLVGKPLVRDAPLERQWLVMLGVSVAWGLLVIRLLAVQAALAAGGTYAGLKAVWRGQAGSVAGIASAFLALVVPVAAVHLALTLVGLRLPLSTPALAALAVVDGAVQALQLALTSALAVVAWRAALRREGRGG